MGKVSIKKNVKPKTIKQKQRQTQKTNVTVNIGSISKKRGRATKKQQLQKKPVQQSSQPVIQSYNQPIFKQTTPQQQPTSLASSILATQSTPAIIKKEETQQTSLQKALQEQNTQIDEPVTKANDLERVRDARLKKLDKPAEEKKEINQEELYRIALLSQSLADQQDDTEEIKALTIRPSKPDIPFISSVEPKDTPSLITPVRPPSKYVNALRGLGLDAVVPSRELLSKSGQRKTLLDFQKFEEERDQRIQKNIHQNAKIQEGINISEESQRETYFDPFEETTQVDEPLKQAEEPSVQPEDIQSTPLKQEEPKGATEMITQTETLSEPTPLTQPTVELGFGGLTEESIQTSVGQILPEEPVSSTVLEVKEKKKKGKTILTPIEPPPQILQAQEPVATILTGQPYVTETLVKDEPAGGAPFAEASLIIPQAKITPGNQVKNLWQELYDSNELPAGTKKTKEGGRKSIEDYADEIRTVDRYKDYKIPEKSIENTQTPGPKIGSSKLLKVTPVKKP